MMKGKFEEGGKTYEWWAGKASEEADCEYCVHCRSGDYGVTQYMATEPSEEEAERIARSLSKEVAGRNRQ